MTRARLVAIGSAAFVAVLLADLSYSFGKFDARKQLDAYSVDLPVDEDAPDSETGPESSHDTQD